MRGRTVLFAGRGVDPVDEEGAHALIHEHERLRLRVLDHDEVIVLRRQLCHRANRLNEVVVVGVGVLTRQFALRGRRRRRVR